MAEPGEREHRDVRASDDDRNRVTEQLRVHCADGRITVEELEYRLSRAMSAHTVRELAELVDDLPRVTLPAEHPSRPALRVGPPGIRPFTYRFVLPSPMERTRVVALDTLAAGLNRSGWELLHQSPASLEFTRGRKERVVIDLEPNGTMATTLIVHGRAPWSARRQFAKLAQQ